MVLYKCYMLCLSTVTDISLGIMTGLLLELLTNHSVQFVHLHCAVLTVQTVTSAVQSNHARRPNGTATFSVYIGIVRVSGLHHRKIEVVSSSLVGPDTANLCGLYVDVLVRGTARSPRVDESRQLRRET